MKWFDFFISNIPPIRPVLLIQDGHASDISIDLIEKARANDIHLLCLPAHTTHILQPEADLWGGGAVGNICYMYVCILTKFIYYTNLYILV